jgi:uncharacterized protein (TIGR02246 family)
MSHDPGGLVSRARNLGLASRELRAVERLIIMNRFLSLVAVAILLTSMACASVGVPADVQSQILQIDAEWSGAAQARDVDRVLAFWADDAIVFPPGSPPLEGKPAIREFVLKSFQTPGFSTSWKTTNVAVSRVGDLAYAMGTNRVSFTGPDGRQTTVEGKAVTVWRREKEGVWKCVIDIWND